MTKKLSEVEWAEYKVLNLFDNKKVSKKLNKEKCDIEGKYPVFSSETSNNGIIGYTNEPEFICNEETPIYVNFGDHTRSFNLTKESFSVLDNVKVLKPKQKHNYKTLLFITTLWKKDIPNLGYSRHWKIAKDSIIKLPMKNNQIDFEFIENFIAELEAQRAAELEAYLQASGLKNYELNNKEKASLDDFNNLEWKEFKLDDLFEKLELKFKKSIFNKDKDVSKEKNKEFDLPLVNAKYGDNGVMYYGRSKDFESAEMTIDIVNDGAISTGTVYSQPQKTGVLYNAYLIKSKFDITNEVLYFFSSCIQKSIKLKYSYENKASWNKVKNDFISLPVKNNEIDFEFIQILINSIKKTVIKNVVDYADKKIQLTNRAINKN
nr:restriction endonuclease subunit S [Ureaplasma parvum]